MTKESAKSTYLNKLLSYHSTQLDFPIWKSWWKYSCDFLSYVWKDIFPDQFRGICSIITNILYTFIDISESQQVEGNYISPFKWHCPNIIMLATQLTSRAASASQSNFRLPVSPAFLFCFIQVTDDSEKKKNQCWDSWQCYRFPGITINIFPILCLLFVTCRCSTSLLSYLIFNSMLLGKFSLLSFWGKSIYSHLLLSQKTNGQIFKEIYSVYSFFSVLFFYTTLFVKSCLWILNGTHKWPHVLFHKQTTLVRNYICEIGGGFEQVQEGLSSFLPPPPAPTTPPPVWFPLGLGKTILIDVCQSWMYIPITWGPYYRCILILGVLGGFEA